MVPEIDEKPRSKAEDERSKSYGRLYESYRNAIFSFLRGFVRSDDLADDFTQETFIQAGKYYDKARIKNEKNWLFAIAKNIYLMYRRKKESRVQFLADLKTGEQAYPVEFESRIHSEILFNAAVKKLSQIDVRYAEIFTLRVKKEWQYSEIGKKLGIPRRTLTTYAAQIKTILNKEFDFK